MEMLPVTFGVPALVRLNNEPIVTMIKRDNLYLIERLPLVVVMLAFIVGSVGYVSSGAIHRIASYQGLVEICAVSMMVIAGSFMFMGKRIRIPANSPLKSDIVFLPFWTLSLAGAGLAALGFIVAGTMG